MKIIAVALLVLFAHVSGVVPLGQQTFARNAVNFRRSAYRHTPRPHAKANTISVRSIVGRSDQENSHSREMSTIGT